MGQEHVYTDSSVDKILNRAAKELDTSKEELAYRVLKEEKGLLGLRNKVIAEVWLKSSEPSEQPQEQNPGDGLVAIKEGKVTIIPPKGEGRNPIITVGENVKVFVNGEEVKGAVEVKETDLVTVEVIHRESEAYFEVDVSEDKMTVTLKVEKKTGKAYRINDTSEKNVLTISAIPVEEISPKEITLEEVKAELEKKKVIYGVDYETIQKVIALPSSTEAIVIAEGKKGEMPVDETIIYHFMNKEEGYVQEEAQKIDHRERKRIVIVETGELLAEKTPAQLGKEGIDVTGGTWSPPLPKIVNLQAGKGVELVANGMKAVASQDGQPQLKGNRLSVNPVYEVKEVSLDSGNIDFNGTVIVRRNIEESMTVKAKEAVEVGGSVNKGTVICGGSVSVKKNIFASKVVAGGETATYQVIKKHLEPLPVELNKMISKAGPVKENLASRGAAEQFTDGYIISIMLEKMHSQVQVEVKKLVNIVESTNHKLEEEIETLALMLKQRLLGAGPSSLDFATLGKISRIIERSINTINALIDNTADIEAAYMQNAAIEASGNVTITGKGCYNSTIHAGGKVDFTGKPGVFRGGDIYASGDVTVGELGSPSGALTNITVPKAAKITANKVYSNVIVNVGSFSEKIQESATYFEAWVSDRGLETTKKKS